MLYPLVSKLLDEENMDTSPQTNYHLAYSKALDTPNTAESCLSVTSPGDIENLLSSTSVCGK